ncbi:MAG: DUF1292 domain-containing protein [Clostridiales bacterium]|nr:DUF1292 domain-containing protein [Clostridiales bacterium]
MDKEKELLEELNEPIELIDDEGNKMEFLHIGTMDFEGKNYAFFQPCESVEGSDPDEVVIFEIDVENKTLLPIEDEDYLEKIFNQFEEEYYAEYAGEDDQDYVN